jgi:hypothetical protein
MRSSSPDVAGPCKGPEVVESRGFETLTGRPSETGATDPSVTGDVSSQAPRQERSLRVAAQALDEALTRFCQCASRQHIRMSIPAQPDDDDVVIYRALSAAKGAIESAKNGGFVRLRHWFDFRGHLARQAVWSAETFGPGKHTAGIVDHIRKELAEVHHEEECGRHSLHEWIDVVILGLEGAWRSGATPDQIIEALAAKQAKNEARTWPDWRTADPSKAIEHDRSADATRSPDCGLDLKLARGDGRTAEARRDRFTGFPGAPDGFVVEHPAEAAGDAPTS